jgi:hypothetical protein
MNWRKKMTDKDLLKLAAESADIEIQWDEALNGWVMPNDEHGWFSIVVWNPLENSAQAFNLAVKLRLDVLIRGIQTLVPYSDTKPVKHGENPYAATRRAIVQTAADIQEAHIKEVA